MTNPNDRPRRHDRAYDAPLPRPRWTLGTTYDSPISGVTIYEDEPVRVAGYVAPPEPAPVLDGYGIYF